VNIFNPEVVIVAGFLGAVFDFDQHRFLEVLKANSLAASNERVIVRRSGLGSDLLMIGAAELPFRSLLARPSEFEFVRAQAKR
jgi:predicted NBD/HSP70 family sugar kinase